MYNEAKALAKQFYAFSVFLSLLPSVDSLVHSKCDFIVKDYFRIATFVKFYITVNPLVFNISECLYKEFCTSFTQSLYCDLVLDQDCI